MTIYTIDIDQTHIPFIYSKIALNNFSFGDKKSNQRNVHALEEECKQFDMIAKAYGFSKEEADYAQNLLKRASSILKKHFENGGNDYNVPEAFDTHHNQFIKILKKAQERYPYRDQKLIKLTTILKLITEVKTDFSENHISELKDSMKQFFVFTNFNAQVKKQFQDNINSFIDAVHKQDTDKVIKKYENIKKQFNFMVNADCEFRIIDRVEQVHYSQNVFQSAQLLSVVNDKDRECYPASKVFNEYASSIHNVKIRHSSEGVRFTDQTTQNTEEKRVIVEKGKFDRLSFVQTPAGNKLLDNSEYIQNFLIKGNAPDLIVKEKIVRLKNGNKLRYRYHYLIVPNEVSKSKDYKKILEATKKQAIPLSYRHKSSLLNNKSNLFHT